MPRKANKFKNPIIPYTIIPGDVWRCIFTYLDGRDLENLSKCLKIKMKGNKKISNKLKGAKIPKTHDITPLIFTDKNYSNLVNLWLKNNSNYQFIFYDFFICLHSFLLSHNIDIRIDWVKKLFKLIKMGDQFSITIFDKTFTFETFIDKAGPYVPVNGFKDKKILCIRPVMK